MYRCPRIASSQVWLNAPRAGRPGSPWRATATTRGIPPHGVGTIRLMSLRGGIRARERLLAWDENRRFAYRVAEIHMPGIRAFMEEWTVAPVPEDRTELQWALAFDCARPARLELQLTCNGWGRSSARHPQDDRNLLSEPTGGEFDRRRTTTPSG